jgi:hypothetical protein
LRLKYIIERLFCFSAVADLPEEESKLLIKASLKLEERDDRTPPLM